jgi:signal transduction histidine kinase
MTTVRTTLGEHAAEQASAAERGLNRAGWAILLIGMALVVSSAAHVAARITLPTDGWSYTSGAIGTELQDTITYESNLIGRSSPLQAGDFVLAVEGHSFDELMTNAAGLQPPLIDTWQAGTTARYLVRRGGTEITLDVPLYHRSSQDVVRLVFGDPSTFVMLFNLVLGLFVFLKRPHDFAARVLFMLNSIWLTIHISSVVYWGLPEMMHPPIWLVAVLFSNWIFGALAAPTMLLLALTFPQPKRFVLRRALLVTIALYSILPLLVAIFGPQAFLGWGWTTMCSLLSLISVAHTLFTAKDPVSRAQIRWAGLGFAVPTLNLLLAATSGFGVYPAWSEQTFQLLNPFMQLAFPTALAVAILRYRLFDIDLILSRALVYGALTLCVMSLYIGMAAYLGALFHGTDDLIFSLIATGVVAVAFQPLRVWLQRGVNRLLFGRRDEPYAVITAFGRRLDTTSDPDAVFTAIVETIGQTLKLPYVAIITDDETQPQAVFTRLPEGRAQPPERLVRLPLSYQNQAVGVLRVAPRIGEERFNQADRKLLNDLAQQTGIAMYAARITADVQRSRERVVLARKEERRRLRRDLHDGLGPQLASQTLTLDVIARQLHSAPAQAEALLVAVREQVQQAVIEIRDLIYGLRPPALDDLGLNGAIQEFADRVTQQHGSPQISVQLAAIDVPLPAAVEVAAYRIVQEAVTNVVKHAQAGVCEIYLEVRGTANAVDVDDTHETAQDARLILAISDNGVGIPTDRLSGVGLQSMRERAEELGGQLQITAASGGGALIRATLPITHRSHSDEHRDPDR